MRDIDRVAPVDAVVIGGSIAGMAAALALCRQGLKVVCLERDATPMPADHHQAWEHWLRDGAGQTRHSHVLLAPLVNSIKENAADFFDILLASGAEVQTFEEVARNVFEDPAFDPRDDEITFLACRRVVFEYLLRRYLMETLAETDFAFIDGAAVRSIKIANGREGRRATGVTARVGGRNIDVDADLVIDASGRHGRSDRWLAEAGIEPAPQEEHPCGIFYTSRFYRLREGADYPTTRGRQSRSGGVAGIDFGYLKAGIFRSDNRTFSITLAADPEDEPLRRLAREREFDVATRTIEETRAWIDQAVAEPISKVYLYGNLANSRRRYVVGGQPLLHGYFALGDASVHTNPIAGRGCALAWVSAFELAETLLAESDDTRRVVAFEDRMETMVVPWYEYQVARDREAIEINKALQRGEDPFDFVRADGTVDEAIQRRVILRKGLGYAARQDIRILRLLFREINLLDPPGTGARQSDLAPLVFQGYLRSKDDPPAGPDRAEFLEALDTA